MSSDRDLFPVVDQLLKDSGAEHLISGDGADKFRQDAAEQLRIIGQSAVAETDRGGPKVLLPDGSTHLRLAGTVWPLLTCAVSFMFIGLDQSKLTYGIAGSAIIKALRDLANVARILDPAQRIICRAVLEVMREKKAKFLDPECSEEELRSHFKKAGQLAPIKLEDNLKALVKINVLREKNYPNTGAHYSVTF
jgi:hypothetical protein